MRTEGVWPRIKRHKNCHASFVLFIPLVLCPRPCQATTALQLGLAKSRITRRNFGYYVSLGDSLVREIRVLEFNSGSNEKALGRKILELIEKNQVSLLQLDLARIHGRDLDRESRPRR